MCPSSPRQTWSSNLNHTASQLFQVASPQADQRRLMWMARKGLGSPSQVGQKSETAAWTPATTLVIFLLSYLCIDSSQCLVPWYAYFLAKEMNSVITGKLCLPQRQLQLKCNLWCRNTKWQVFCSLATFWKKNALARHHGLAILNFT